MVILIYTRAMEHGWLLTFSSLSASMLRRVGIQSGTVFGEEALVIPDFQFVVLDILQWWWLFIFGFVSRDCCVGAVSIMGFHDDMMKI
jgi:hypothetical protein